MTNGAYHTIRGILHQQPQMLFARFGFELASVNKPGNKNQEPESRIVALNWHEKLFRVINTSYTGKLVVNLSYQKQQDTSLVCRIFITVTEAHEEILSQTLRGIQNDLAPFFSDNSQISQSPYLFSEIRDINLLANIHTLPVGFQQLLFYRSPLLTSPTTDIGFPKTNPAKQSGETSLLPGYIPPKPDTGIFDNGLLKALLNQPEGTEVSVTLKPYLLADKKTAHFRQMISTPSLISQPGYTPEHKLRYTEFLGRLLNQRENNFTVRVSLKSREALSEEYTKTAVKQFFFGANTQVLTDIGAATSGNPSCTGDLHENELVFLYPVETAIQSFRLPLPSSTTLMGIESQDFVFQQLPTRLSEEGILIGQKKTLEGKIEIKLDLPSLSRHMYIMGQTGTGKSTLLKTMIKDCLRKNYGFTVIDPHGDLYTDVMQLMDEDQRTKVKTIVPTDPDNAFTINPLDFDVNQPQTKSLVINELYRIISTLYDMRAVGGPVFEEFFKHALILVMDQGVRNRFGKLTLKDACRLFLDAAFRKALLGSCGDKLVIEFFKNAELGTGDMSFHNFSNYITSKLNRFVNDYYLEPILSGSGTNIDFRQVMDNSEILMVRMDKGKMGTENTSLLGQVVLSRLFLSGMARTDIAKKERKPYFIFIDEFQNFLRSDVGTALSEMRKYRICLVLANQTLGQLDSFLVESLMGNAGNLVFFRPGILDYYKMQHYFEPEFNRSDVLRLPNYHCIARLMMDNKPSDPFVFQTLQTMAGLPQNQENRI